LPCSGGKKLDDSSRLDVVEIARVHDLLPSLFLSLCGLRTYQHPGIMCLCFVNFPPSTATVFASNIDRVLLVMAR